MHWQKSVEIALAADVPVILWGPPGIGKTSYVYGLAKALGTVCEVVIASLREPSDFLGLPVLDGETVKMAPPAWARRLADVGEGLLVFDEITTAPPAVQAALLRVVLERVVGDLPLPRKVRVLAIANPAEEAAGWDLSLPLANRFLHIKAEGLGTEAWTKGLISGWKTEVSYLGSIHEAGGATLQAKSEISGFLNARSELMLKKPTDKDKEKEAWPSPRTWEMASKVLALAYSAGAPASVEVQLMMGAIGVGAAREFMSWKKTLDLPDPAVVLKDPRKFKVPKRADITFAALGSVVGYTLPRLQDAKLGPKLYNNCWEILAMVCKAGQPDVAVPSARVLAQSEKDHNFERPETIEDFGEILGL
jgi:hypothetical protein